LKYQYIKPGVNLPGDEKVFLESSSMLVVLQLPNGVVYQLVFSPWIVIHSAHTKSLLFCGIRIKAKPGYRLCASIIFSVNLNQFRLNSGCIL